MEDNGSIDIRFSLNGRLETIKTAPLTRLIDILRNEFRLTSVKEGCGEGACGSCSVVFNGRLSLSCLIPASKLEGSEVLTVDGVIETERGRIIQEAFIKEGGIQCGFCTPGFILACYAFLDKTTCDIRDAIDGNLCRCTGYYGIIRAMERDSR